MGCTRGCVTCLLPILLSLVTSQNLTLPPGYKSDYVIGGLSIKVLVSSLAKFISVPHGPLPRCSPLPVFLPSPLPLSHLPLALPPLPFAYFLLLFPLQPSPLGVGQFFWFLCSSILSHPFDSYHTRRTSNSSGHMRRHFRNISTG